MTQASSSIARGRHRAGLILSDEGVAAWWQTANPTTDAIDLVDDPELAVWLIETAGAAVGVAMASEESDPQYRHGSIDIALAEADRGQGLGPAAVRTVARWLIDVHGHHRLTIDPSTANSRAIAACATVGFRPVGTTRALRTVAQPELARRPSHGPRCG